MSWLSNIGKSLTGSAGSILGGLGGSLLENQWNRSSAAKLRNWQTEMSNTAHQREVEDLKAAGLNPILSAGGSGASVPSGAKAGVPTVGANLNSAFANATARKTAIATIKNTEAQAETNTVNAKLQKEALAYYEKNRNELQSPLMTGILSKHGNIRGEAAITAKGMLNVIKKAQKKVPKAVDKITAPFVKRHYDDLNSKTGNSKKSPYQRHKATFKKWQNRKK